MGGEVAVAVETTPSSRGSGRPSGGGYIPVLDGLRAVSIGLVLIGHLVLNRHWPTADAAEAGFRLSSVGVSVFFVVSGYLITLLLLREERRDGSISLKKFYLRRALRIFPAFYTYLLVFFALAASGFIVGVPWYDYVASICYVRNIYGRALETTHLWSLSLEEQFYLIWPTVMVLVAARRRLGVLAVAFAAFTAWRAYLLATGRMNWWKLYVYPDQRMDTILVGCGLALLIGGERFERLSRSVLERTWFAAAAAVALVAWLVAVQWIPGVGVVEHTTTAVLIACLIHWLVRRPDSPVSWALRRPWMLFVGRLSYSLYLWQQMFLIEQTPQLDLVRRFPLDLILTFACALTSYYVVERPFLALKDRYFR
jgi:peptidoglycan/LPS O-acetylase OafA/YrhL